MHVAHQVLGDGPGDLVYARGAFTHLDVMWELPAFRRFCEQLASFTRLIWFDKRGMGLSDHVRLTRPEAQPSGASIGASESAHRHTVVDTVRRDGSVG